MLKRGGGRGDSAGAEVIGAILLFGLFVTVIAFLNVTAVPSAGLRNEDAHFESVLDALNGLQSSAEATSTPGAEGATASAGFPLSPPRSVGQDFFSFFVAEPARSSGELAFEPDHGNLTLYRRDASATTHVDVGSLTSRFPVGLLTFDPHPNFRSPGVVRVENGAVLLTDSETASLRFSPPVTVSVSGSTTLVAVKARVLNGTGMSVGGTTDVRVSLETEAAALVAPAANNAAEAVLRLETTSGSAWGAYLNATSEAAGLESPGGYETAVAVGAGEGGLDVVTWTVHGVGSGNDVRLTSGVAVHRLRVS